MLCERIYVKNICLHRRLKLRYARLYAKETSACDNYIFPTVLQNKYSLKDCSYCEDAMMRNMDTIDPLI